jgi:hypothetical protein
MFNMAHKPINNYVFPNLGFYKTTPTHSHNQTLSHLKLAFFVSLGGPNKKNKKYLKKII